MDFSSIIFLFLGLLSTTFLWNIGRKDKFLESESNRCLNNLCEISPDWNSNGNVYTRGLTFTENKNKNLKIIKQAKFCDVGLLK